MRYVAIDRFHFPDVDLITVQTKGDLVRPWIQPSEQLSELNQG